MTYHERDPWQQAADDAGALEGARLTCAKGIWSRDGVPIGADELAKMRIVVLMESAQHGELKWVDHKVAERQMAFYSVVPPSGEYLGDDWSPATQFVCVDLESRAEMTFTSAAWSGRRAFSTLLKPWLRRGKTMLPVCSLSSKPRKNDPNGNIDPIIDIVGWVARGEFDDTAALPERVEFPALEGPKDPAPLPPIEGVAGDYAGHDPNDDVAF
jgi:hypothetical protein